MQTARHADVASKIMLAVLALGAASAGLYFGSKWWAKPLSMQVGDAPDGLKIHQTANLASTPQGLIPNGTFVTATGPSPGDGSQSDGWYEVTYQGKKGYVSGNYLFPVQASSPSKLSSSSSDSPSGTSSSSSLSPGDSSSSPPTATPLRVPIVVLGNPLVLSPGKKYRARLKLTGMAANPSLGTPARIASTFTDLGFQKVDVFMDAAALPADWPAAYRAGFSDGSTARWGEAVYAGAAQALPKPDQIADVWEWAEPLASGTRVGADLAASLGAQMSAGLLQGGNKSILLPGEILPVNTRLKSPSNKAFFILQGGPWGDANGVLYKTDASGLPERALWQTGTKRKGYIQVKLNDRRPGDPVPATVDMKNDARIIPPVASKADPRYWGPQYDFFAGYGVMQKDGNFVIYDENNRPLWDSKTNNYPLPQAGAYLAVQDDGNMVIYKGYGADGRPNRTQAIWSTETYGFENHHESKDIFAAVWRDVTGAWGWVRNNVPGTDWVSEQLHDFANSKAGQLLFQTLGAAAGAALVVATAGAGGPVTAAVAGALGAGLGTGAGALVGSLLRGDALDQAFFASVTGAFIAFTKGLESQGIKLGVEQVQAMFADDFAKITRFLDDFGRKNSLDYEWLANEAEDQRINVAKTFDIAAIAQNLDVMPALVQSAVNAATHTVNAGGLQFDEYGNIKKKVTGLAEKIALLKQMNTVKKTVNLKTAVQQAAMASPPKTQVSRATATAYAAPASATTTAFTPVAWSPSAATTKTSASTTASKSLADKGLDVLLAQQTRGGAG